MSPCFKNGRRRAGVIIFVVMGGIFVLTILVMAYNHLVQGKFNESREILRHLRAMKIAQSSTRYLVARIKNDLAVTDHAPGAPGAALREAFTKNNTEAALADEVNKYIDKLVLEGGFNDLKRELACDVPAKDISITPSVAFSELVPLSSRKKGNELYLDFEKAGRMTVSVVAMVGRAREEWLEVRPFRVVVPYPLPITKFTMYLTKAADPSDEVKFNTVTIESPDTGKVAADSGSKPFVLMNGMAGDQHNSRENVWEDRGWIYLGGGKISLNRAGGHRNFGQGFHSYFPEADKPITLRFNFLNKQGGKFDGVQIGSKKVIFTVARWGFSKALYAGNFSNIWKEVLKGEFAARNETSDKKWWNSSSLHLFGLTLQSSGEKLISHTRVVGDVYDRYLDICYLADESTMAPYGAVISHGSGSFNNIIQSNSSGTNAGSIFTSVFADKLVFMSIPPQQAFGIDHMRELEDFFLRLDYRIPGDVIAYRKIMSRADSSPFEETYEMISQYSKYSQKIDYPPNNPNKIIPVINDMEFKLKVLGHDTEKLAIDKIVMSDDSTQGLSRRVCYEIGPEHGDNLFNVLKDNFCLSNNSDFNLGNTVVRVKTGDSMVFGDSLGIKTGGSIIVDGSIRLGTFSGITEQHKAPLLIMSEKGEIVIKNSSNPVLAYLVALDSGKGRIKFENPSSKVEILGGIAAHTMEPADIKGGGTLFYNEYFDPTKDSFRRYVGVAIGPAGGDI